MIVSPSLVGRFRAPLGWIEASDSPVGIAVSGGPDSLALLLLAHTAWPERVIAATVDHGLRAESADEADFVAELCAARGIAHRILVPSEPISGSLQANARKARYALLEEWRISEGACSVMTAHHADDQAETLLMRLNRGAGVGGLAGIRAVNRKIVRPLLGWRQAELEAIVGAAGIIPLRDPSNKDPHFDRVRMRDALAAAPWLDAAAVARSAAHLADAEEALTWMAEKIADERISAQGQALVLNPAGLPEEIVRRLLIRVIARMDPAANPSGPELDRLLASLRSGGRSSIGALIASGGETWRLSPAPPRRKGD